MSEHERSGFADVPTESVRLGALSLPARVAVALVVGAVAVYGVWHLLIVYLFVAPSNTVSEEHRETIRSYMYPEFEQNWKLFAPNPLQRNVAVHVRAEVREADGGQRVTDWVDLTAIDIANVRHNPLPSHRDQNILRRAWDFYSGAHDEDGEPVGERGELSEQYLRRIALLRLSQIGWDVDSVVRIQLREAVERVPAPDWRPEDIDTSPVYDEQDWWPVTSRDLPQGALAAEGSDR
jgi:hypothetical protein